MTSLADDIDRVFTPWDHADSPGCAVLVMKDRAPLYRRGHGLASLVSMEDGRLMVGWPPAADELIPLAANRFRLGVTDVEAVFVPTPKGDARLEVIGSAREIESTLGPRVYARCAPAHPAAERLPEYAGRYQSVEAGTLRFLVDNGTLVLRTTRNDDIPLEPTGADEFFDRRMALYTFARNARGVVESVHVTTDRIRMLPFERQGDGVSSPVRKGDAT